MSKHRELSVRQEHELLMRLERAGLNDPKLAQAIIESGGNFIARKMVAVAKRRGLEVSIHQKLARDIMGDKRYFGAEDWLELYASHGLEFTKKQLVQIAEFPWGDDELILPDPWEEDKPVRKTHFAFLGVKRIGKRSLNLPLWHQIHPGPEHPKFWTEWNPKNRFAQKTCELRWYLMRIGIVPESTGISYSQQVAMLPDSYEVPLTVERVTANFLFYQKNGGYLDQDYWAQCQDQSAHGSCVVVGHFGDRGLGVNDWGDDAAHGTGVAASRKIPS